MNIWFTSDTHFGHTNIAGPKVSVWKNGYRNFNSVQEMNDALVTNINKIVGEDDILYHLGDWSFGGVHNIYYFRKSLICKNIHLILGNHDQHITNKDIKFHDTSFNPIDLFTSVQEVKTEKIGKSYFHLSHYSHQVWPGSHKGVIHLFGHSHGSLKGLGKSMDVGVDTHPEFRPYHINEIVKKMEKIPVNFIDHHEESTNI
jgi:calcineurin-like phosphoesterase family protein